MLPNNANVILSAEQAAEPCVQAGAGRPHALDSGRDRGDGRLRRLAPAAENAAAMDEAVAAVATGAVTTASREVELNGLAVRKGAFLGLLEGEPVAGGSAFDEVAAAVVERLLAEPREVLTLLTGEDAPTLNGLLDRIAERYPEGRVDVQDGGQPNYHLLLSAE